MHPPLDSERRPMIKWSPGSLRARRGSPVDLDILGGDLESSGIGWGQYSSALAQARKANRGNLYLVWSVSSDISERWRSEISTQDQRIESENRRSNQEAMELRAVVQDLQRQIQVMQRELSALKATHDARNVVTTPASSSQYDPCESTIVWAGRWIDEHRLEYLGKWVALTREGLQASGDTPVAVNDELKRQGRTLDRMFLTRVRG